MRPVQLISEIRNIREIDMIGMSHDFDHIRIDLLKGRDSVPGIIWGKKCNIVVNNSINFHTSLSGSAKTRRYMGATIGGTSCQVSIRDLR